jgi:hypothetical protein
MNDFNPIFPSPQPSPTRGEGVFGQSQIKILAVRIPHSGIKNFIRDHLFKPNKEKNIFKRIKTLFCFGI